MFLIDFCNNYDPLHVSQLNMCPIPCAQIEEILVCQKILLSPQVKYAEQDF